MNESTNMSTDYIELNNTLVSKATQGLYTNEDTVASATALVSNLGEPNQVALCESAMNAINLLGKSMSIAYRTSLLATSVISEMVSQANEICNSLAMRHEQIIQNMLNSFEKYRDFSNNIIFMHIADEIGFPVYLECGTELQEQLLKCYRQNGYQCNVPEMKKIIFEYYSDSYVNKILNDMKRVGTFKQDRMKLIEEGIELYQEKRYGGAGSIFAIQISGMIGDVFEEMISVHKYSRKQKKELIATFKQNCSPDSEKSELLQILDCQNGGAVLWYHVAEHFLNVVYSTKDTHVATCAERHPICHGNQLNYNTKEMNLQLIICMDIISELAWRIKDMKESDRQTVA